MSGGSRRPFRFRHSHARQPRSGGTQPVQIITRHTPARCTPRPHASAHAGVIARSDGPLRRAEHRPERRARRPPRPHLAGGPGGCCWAACHRRRAPAPVYAFACRKGFHDRGKRSGLAEPSSAAIGRLVFPGRRNSNRIQSPVANTNVPITSPAVCPLVLRAAQRVRLAGLVGFDRGARLARPGRHHASLRLYDGRRAS